MIAGTDQQQGRVERDRGEGIGSEPHRLTFWRAGGHHGHAVDGGEGGGGLDDKEVEVVVVRGVQGHNLRGPHHVQPDEGEAAVDGDCGLQHQLPHRHLLMMV